MKDDPYKNDAWYWVELPHRRYFHYEKFPGFVAPKGRRFIILEWVYMLLFNAWSYIFDKPVCRTLIRFSYGEPEVYISEKLLEECE